jgi:hypothetical protein
LTYSCQPSPRSSAASEKVASCATSTANTFTMSSARGRKAMRMSRSIAMGSTKPAL